ncbi:MAG: lysophospholipid acyltransferase family protein [Patescibacteria group bacterium]
MIAKAFQSVTYWPIYSALKFFARYKIEGQENLKGLENGGVIFASNHASFIDPQICGMAMPRESLTPQKFFPVRFLAAYEFFRWFKNPAFFPFSIIVAAYVRLNASIPVIRGLNNIEQNLAKAVEAVKNGDKIWIYPEGRVSKDGNIQKGKKGIVYLHQKTGAPIVPVGIIGNFGILSFKTLLRKNSVKIKIGRPIRSLIAETPEEAVSEVMRQIGDLVSLS